MPRRNRNSQNGYSHAEPIRNFVGKPCPYCAVRMTVPVKDQGVSMPRTMVTRDHLQPKARGHCLGRENRVICCFRCNQNKGSLTIEQWHQRLVIGGDPRAKIVSDFICKRNGAEAFASAVYDAAADRMVAIVDRAFIEVMSK